MTVGEGGAFEDIRADALSADVCALGTLVASGAGVALTMASAGGPLVAGGFLSFLASLFLLILCLHFFRRARMAAEETYRTAEQMRWEQWVSTLPASVRWVAPSRRRAPWPPPPSPTKAPKR